MSDETHTQPDENANRSNDGYDEHDEYDGEMDDQSGQMPLPFPLITRIDLTLVEAAELDMWQVGWQRGTVSDEEFAHVIQRIYTQVCIRSGLEAVPLDAALQAVHRLWAYLRHWH